MRILVISAYGYWGDFLPTDLDHGDRQVGGGETAMIQVSRHLADLGHEVIVFYDVAEFGSYYGVDYLPVALYPNLVCTLDHDVLVAWDAPHALRFRDRAKAHVLAFQLNDAQIGVMDYAVDLYFHPSKWHAERFLGLYPEMVRSKVRPYMTNGVDPNRYVGEVKREPHRVIYSSSPDRGLHHLLHFWPRVREQVTDAELHVYYDMDKWLGIEGEMAARGQISFSAERAAAVRQVREDGIGGVTFHGGVGQGQLAEEQLKSALMVYPCDPLFPTEGFSMTCLEAITAGCRLVTSDADALKELWADAPGVTILPLPVDDDVWVSTIVKNLESSGTQPVKLGLPHLWRSVAKRWEQELTSCLNTLASSGS